MSNYNSLKTIIDANIKRNGVKAITGQVLNAVLRSMVSALGAGYQYGGIATPSTDPGTPDAKVFYFANGVGTYTNFGGIQVSKADDVIILVWDSAWHKVVTGIATGAKIGEFTETNFGDTYVKGSRVNVNLTTDLFDFGTLEESLLQISDYFENHNTEIEALQKKTAKIEQTRDNITLDDNVDIEGGLNVVDDITANDLKLLMGGDEFSVKVLLQNLVNKTAGFDYEDGKYLFDWDIEIPNISVLGDFNASAIYTSQLKVADYNIVPTLEALLGKTKYIESSDNGVTIDNKVDIEGSLNVTDNVTAYDILLHDLHSTGNKSVAQNILNLRNTKMSWCGLESDGTTITLEGETTPLTFTQIKALIDDPTRFVALKYGAIFWLLPQYDDEGGAIIFTGTSALSATGELWRIAINSENQVSQYSIWLENAYLKTDDLSKEKIDNFNTYPTTKAVNEKTKSIEDKINNTKSVNGESIFGEGDISIEDDSLDDIDMGRVLEVFDPPCYEIPYTCDGPVTFRIGNVKEYADPDDVDYANETIEKEIVVNESGVLKIDFTPYSWRKFAIEQPHLTSVDLSNIPIFKARNIDRMFRGTSSISTNITSVGDISNWDISNIDRLQGVFSYCSELLSLNLTNWDVSKVTTLNYFLNGCQKLQSIGDLSNWDVSQLEDLSQAFTNCKVLTYIGDLSNWDVSKVTTMNAMFQSCRAITTLNLSNWQMLSSCVVTKMFNGCSALRTIFAIGASETTLTKIREALTSAGIINNVNIITNEE